MKKEETTYFKVEIDTQKRKNRLEPQFWLFCFSAWAGFVACKRRELICSSSIIKKRSITPPKQMTVVFFQSVWRKATVNFPATNESHQIFAGAYEVLWCNKGRRSASIRTTRKQLSQQEVRTIKIFFSWPEERNERLALYRQLTW